jgi:flagellum-specific ATP synthase
MYEQVIDDVKSAETVSHIGKIENIVGLAMEASGGKCSVGDIVMIYSEELGREVPAEVVGFRGDRIQLMTYESNSGIVSGSFVRNSHSPPPRSLR